VGRRAGAGNLRAAEPHDLSRRKKDSGRPSPGPAKASTGAAGDPAKPGRAREAAAKQAALKSIAPDRLLPGEELDSAHVDDATHWIAVYSELLEFKHRIIMTIADQLDRLGAEARAEVERTDAVEVRAEAERFSGRLGFWRRRLEELSKQG
jgi:hypothetical protein